MTEAPVPERSTPQAASPQAARPPAAAPPKTAQAHLSWRVALVLPEQSLLRSEPAAPADKKREAEGDQALSSAVAGGANPGPSGAPVPEVSSQLGKDVADEVSPSSAAAQPQKDVQGIDLEFPRLLSTGERPEQLGRVIVLVDASGHWRRAPWMC